MGHKDPSNRWLITRSSLERYIAEHGRKHGPSTSINELEQRLGELAQRVDEMSNRLDSRTARSSVERERDKYRSEAASLREVARLLAASSSDARIAAAKLLESSGRDLQAVSQLLAPTDLADLMPTEERSEVG